MSIKRRSLLATLSGTLTALTLAPLRARAVRPTRAFESASLEDAIEAQFGVREYQAGNIAIGVPGGNVDAHAVPVAVSFDLPGAWLVSLFVEANRHPLAASFKLSPRAGSHVATSLRFEADSRLHAVVKTRDGVYGASIVVDGITRG